MPVAKKTGRRPGRPPGAKNKPKVPIVAPEPVVARSNGIRRTRRTSDRVALAGSIISINRKHMLLIQKWSGETKIGVQQIFDDIFLAGASAAYKSFYRGLINSRKAAEAQFDAEANTQELADKAIGRTEPVNRLPGSGSHRPAPRPVDEEQLSLAPLGPGQLEETDTDLEAIVGLDMHAAAIAAGLTPGPEVDAPPSVPPVEEEPEEEPEADEPPY